MKASYLYLFFIFSCCFLLSCATKKISVKDEYHKTEIKNDTCKNATAKQDTTINEYKKETTEKEKIQQERTVEKSDSAILLVDTQGNVVRKEVWHKEKETLSRNREYEKLLLDSIAKYRSVRDSVNFYKTQCNSLLEKINHQETKVIERTKIPKIFKFSLIFTILCSIFALIKLIRWLKTH